MSNYLEDCELHLVVMSSHTYEKHVVWWKCGPIDLYREMEFGMVLSFFIQFGCDFAQMKSSQSHVIGKKKKLSFNVV